MKSHNSKISFLNSAQRIRKVVPRQIIDFIYSIPALNGPIRKLLNSQVKDEIIDVTIKNGILKGMTLKLNLKAEKSYWLNTYELEMIDVIRNHVKKGMVIYDVGANIGYLSMIFAKITGKNGRVYAFEPLPSNIQRIQSHIDVNALNDIVTLIPAAVSDTTDKQLFFVHDLHAMGKLTTSLGRNERYEKKIEVDTVCLNDFVFKQNNHPPDLIKIDIEGGGITAIPGMSEVIEKYRPTILMELHGPDEANAAWEYLMKHQYKMSHITKGYHEITKREELNWKDHILALGEI